MGDMSKAERMRAAQEAKDHVAGAGRSASTDAVGEAMRRYLGAEQYHELRDKEAEERAEAAEQAED